MSIRLSSQQSQENRSRNQICDFLEEHYFVTRSLYPDLGEDILVQIYEKGISTGLSFYLQLKSTADIGMYQLKTNEISYPIFTKDIEHWAAQAVVVLLVIWDVQKKQGWWIWVNDIVQNLAFSNPVWQNNETVNIRIPVSNLLDETGLLNIRYYLANLYFPIISKNRDLIINAKFSFPQTDEGKIKFEELKRHITKGDEVELDGKYIEQFILPDWWQKLYGEIEPSTMQLSMGSPKSSLALPSRMEFTSQLGAEFIPYVDFQVEKQGTEEITFNNKLQNLPFKITLVFNIPEKSLKLSLETNFHNADFPTILHILQIETVLSVEGIIKLITLKNDGVISIPVPANSFPSVQPEIIDFIEKICFIQKSMGIIIQPKNDGKFSENEINIANELVSIINSGSYSRAGLQTTFSLKKAGIGMILAGLEHNSLVKFIITSDESYVEILSQKIKLGPIVQKIQGNWKTPIHIVRDWFNLAQDDDFFDVELDNVELQEEFANWKENVKS